MGKQQRSGSLGKQPGECDEIERSKGKMVTVRAQMALRLSSNARRGVRRGNRAEVLGGEKKKKQNRNLGFGRGQGEKVRNPLQSNTKSVVRRGQTGQIAHALSS